MHPRRGRVLGVEAREGFGDLLDRQGAGESLKSIVYHRSLAVDISLEILFSHLKFRKQQNRSTSPSTPTLARSTWERPTGSAPRPPSCSRYEGRRKQKRRKTNLMDFSDNEGREERVKVLEGRNQFRPPPLENSSNHAFPSPATPEFEG